MSINKNFTLSIFVPTMSAIAMFVISLYAIIIPIFEQSIMERKEEMIIELTNTAWSVLAEHNNEHKRGTITKQEAQEKAAEHIGKMRYGKEQKDYFWIISSHPKMIMHPYRTELNGTDLSDFTDDHGNKVFVDASQLVNDQGSGITQYYWQWKDDASKIVPKRSYVKAFSEWGWIIGTGIYLEDVKLEIEHLKKRLFHVSFIITLIIVIILIYVLRQSKIIEEKRQEAEDQLRISINKYKNLVEASADGMLMVVNKKVVFSNLKFIKFLTVTRKTIIDSNVSDLFELSWTMLEATILENPKKSHSFETILLKAMPGLENVVISVTRVEQAGQIGYIIVVKNVTQHKLLELDAMKLSEDVELSLQLMNQPVHNLVNKNIYCRLTDTIAGAVELMTAHQVRLICIKDRENIIGVLTDTDLRIRVLAKGVTPEQPVSSVMTSPVKSIDQNALLYEAVLLFKQLGISHLLVKDNTGRITGNISTLQCLKMQRNSLSYLVQEINECNMIGELKRIYSKTPLLIQTVFTSSDNINNISRIISSVADAINIRVIELAKKEIGEPPCEFAFIAMGSEGRSEQTMKTDQDNALIFEDSNDENKEYFLKLSELINENLHIIGYSRCNGDLMAGNPEWCNSLQVWKDYFNEWITKTDAKKALDSSIFFDLRIVYGSKVLVSQIQDYIAEKLKSNSEFLGYLVKTVTQQKLLMKEKRVDIKNFLIPIIGYLRVYALKFGIPATNSLMRLHQLVAYGLISEQKGEEIEKMYKFLMHLRIKWQVTMILDNDKPENYVLMDKLTAIDIVTLEKILQLITDLQNDLQSVIKTSE